MSILLAIFSILAADVLRFDFIEELPSSIEFDDTYAIAAIPKAIMEFFAVRSFVVDQQHVLFLAGNVTDHAVTPSLLFDVPNDFSFGLFAMEFRAAKGPELREVKFVALAFVIIGGEKFSF